MVKKHLTTSLTDRTFDGEATFWIHINRAVDDRIEANELIRRHHLPAPGLSSAVSRALYTQ